MNKPAGSKLINFKKWLTLPEVAKRLSLTCNEEVPEADILRFALEGHLKLSVNFVNNVQVAKGKIYPIYPGMDVAKDLNYHFFTLSDEVKTISGICDLPMIGGEQLYVEHEYHRLAGGPAVTRNKYYAAYVIESDGEKWQLQKSFSFAEGNLRLLKELDNLAELKKRKDISKESVEKSFSFYEKKLEKFLEMQELNCFYYVPSNQLPQDSILVVRTEALREFEQLIADNEQESSTTTCNNKSELSETERNTMLKLIIGMAVDAYGYDPDSSRNSATGDKNGISAKLQARGINIDADTVRKYVNEARNIL